MNIQNYDQNLQGLMAQSVDKTMFFFHFNKMKFQFESTAYDSSFFKLLSFHFECPILGLLYSTENIMHLIECYIMAMPKKYA